MNEPVAAFAAGRVPSTPTTLENDFSVVIGGPLYQALRRARLSDAALDMVTRRVVAVVLFAWVPLLLLSLIDGRALGGVELPFVLDVDTHVRFLVALPLMIVAELVVHRRMRVIVSQFISLGLVSGANRERFDAAIERAMRLRNSVVVEIGLIVAVYAAGRLLFWDHYVAMQRPAWYSGGGTGLAAGWYFLVSLPLFQFILLRWYFRIFVWARFLLQVSRIDLAYSPMHPDRLGGLGFLTGIGFAFAPLLVAQGALLAGTLANRILFDGASLPDFKLDVFAMVLIATAVVLGPLLVFVPALAAAKRAGLYRYRHLARDYVDAFEAKWTGGPRPDEPLVGSADVQSLADMGGSYDVVSAMRVIPVSRDAFVQLALLTVLPLAPLLLTMFSLEELAGRLVKVLL